MNAVLNIQKRNLAGFQNLRNFAPIIKTKLLTRPAANKKIPPNNSVGLNVLTPKLLNNKP